MEVAFKEFEGDMHVVFVLFCSVLFCSVLFCSVLFCFVLGQRVGSGAGSPSATQKNNKKNNKTVYRKLAEIVFKAKEIALVILPGLILSSKLFGIFTKNRN